MKKFTIAAMAVMVLASFSLNAADPDSKELKVQILSKADQTFRVIYEAEEKSEVRVNIYDAKSNRIFSDKISQTDGFSKPYNFKNLPQGKYTFEIISNGVKSKEVVDNRVKATKPTMKALVYRTATSGKFQLMVMSNNMDPVNIMIYDHNDQVVHEEHVDSSENFGKVYDLNSIRSNAARFVVTSNQQVIKDQSFDW